METELIAMVMGRGAEPWLYTRTEKELKRKLCILLKALYVPVGTPLNRERENRTTDGIIKVTQSDELFWNDAGCFRPIDNSDVDQQCFLYLVEENMLELHVDDYMARDREFLQQQWDAGTEHPLIVVCGETANAAYEQRGARVFPDEAPLRELGIPGTELRLQVYARFSVLMGAEHPSHYLMSRGRVADRECFNTTWEIANALRLHGGPHTTVDSLRADVKATTAAVLQLKVEKYKEFDMPVREDGLLQDEYRHLRYSNFNDAIVCEGYRLLRDELDTEDYRHVLRKSIGSHMGQAGFAESVLNLRRMSSSGTAFKKSLNDSMVATLGSAERSASFERNQLTAEERGLRIGPLTSDSMVSTLSNTPKFKAFDHNSRDAEERGLRIGPLTSGSMVSTLSRDDKNIIYHASVATLFTILPEANPENFHGSVISALSYEAASALFLQFARDLKHLNLLNGEQIMQVLNFMSPKISDETDVGERARLKIKDLVARYGGAQDSTARLLALLNARTCYRLERISVECFSYAVSNGNWTGNHTVDLCKWLDVHDADVTSADWQLICPQDPPPKPKTAVQKAAEANAAAAIEYDATCPKANLPFGAAIGSIVGFGPFDVRKDRMNLVFLHVKVAGDEAPYFASLYSVLGKHPEMVLAWAQGRPNPNDFTTWIIKARNIIAGQEWHRARRPEAL
jgi:hypothetical protein